MAPLNDLKQLLWAHPLQRLLLIALVSVLAAGAFALGVRSGADSAATLP